jgi:hypothetical protein
MDFGFIWSLIMTFYNFNNLLQRGFLCFQIQNYFYYNIYFAYFLKLIKFVKKQDTENDIVACVAVFVPAYGSKDAQRAAGQGFWRMNEWERQERRSRAAAPSFSFAAASIPSLSLSLTGFCRSSGQNECCTRTTRLTHRLAPGHQSIRRSLRGRIIKFGHAQAC